MATEWDNERSQTAHMLSAANVYKVSIYVYIRVYMTTALAICKIKSKQREKRSIKNEAWNNQTVIIVNDTIITKWLCTPGGHSTTYKQTHVYLPSAVSLLFIW